MTVTTTQEGGADTGASPAELLQKHFGFSEFRPGQEAVINALLTDGAALAVFPTGAGKSLCYQLPALMFEGVTLVVSPLIALMKDQIDFLRGRGIAAARLDSTLGATEAREIYGQLEAGTLKLLYVAPERFNNERFLALLGRTKIALFAVDEAHCISEWGHNFRPDYLKLAETARSLKVERVLALTATATPSVVQGHLRGLRHPRQRRHRYRVLSTQPEPLPDAGAGRGAGRATDQAAAGAQGRADHRVRHAAKDGGAGGGGS